MNVAREVVASLVRLHGFKRGVSHAARALGCSESWVRKIHYGEAERISAEVAARAAVARGIVLRARLDAALREIEIIEGAMRGGDVEGGDAHGVSAGGLVL